MIIFVKIRLFKVKFGQENFSKTGKKEKIAPKYCNNKKDFQNSFVFV